MNNKILLGFGAVAVAVVLVGAAFMMSKNSSQAPTDSSSTGTDAQGSAQKSIKDLLTSGQAQQCTYKNKMADTDAEGTVYVSNGKMRTDFTTNSGGQAISGHMILSDNKSYTWMDGQTTGMMLAFDPSTMTDGTKPTGTSSDQSVDINKYVDYSCSGWPEDASVFTPPSNVKFNDAGSIVKPSGIQSGVGDAQNACSACDSLPSDEKAQCRTALKCN